MKDKEEKEQKAQELFKLHYDELCEPYKKHVRNAMKNAGDKLIEGKEK